MIRIGRVQKAGVESDEGWEKRRAVSFCKKAGALNIVALLKACGEKKDLRKGFKLHAYIQGQNFLEKNCFVASSLVSMYARCGAVSKAQEVLEELPVRDVVAWNALIAGYAQQNQGEEALNYFEIMRFEGHSPNAVTFLCVFKACGSILSATKVENFHDIVASMGMLEREVLLGTTLVDMYARFGALAKAQRLLDELPIRNVVTWTTLIAGYVEQAQAHEALKCFDIMQCEGHSPNAVTFIFALKACGSIGSAVRGEVIHYKIMSLGMLEKDNVLGSTLVDMYVRCGALTRARSVLNELSVRSVITWTALIAGHIQQGECKEALKCFDSMQFEGHSPNLVAFICALKACASIGAVAKGEKIHKKVVSLGMLEKDIILGSILVDMYARYGALAKAQQVLEELLVRDVIAWNTLIAGYIEHGKFEEALKCLDIMQFEGYFPNVVTIIYALKACGSIGAAAKGEKIYEKLISLGVLQKCVMLESALMDMYARCGALNKAQEVFNKANVQDVVMWNTLIAGYAQHGQAEEALKCFDRMGRKGHFPNAITYICVLKACGDIRAVVKGEMIHENIINLGILEKDDVIGSALINMYGRCDALAKAQKVLDELPVRNAVTWTALIAAYAEQGQGHEALKCFDNMQCDGYSPSAVTFIHALKACGSIGAIAKGEMIHKKIIGLNMLEKNVVLGSALVEMYVRCYALAKAEHVLNKLPIRNAITWNILIAGYAQHDQDEDALKCFESSQQEGHSPSGLTFVCVLKACGSRGVMDQGEQIHDKVVSLGLLDTTVGNILVDMYAKCGALVKAAQLFEELPIKNIVTWNIVIGGYAQQGQSGEAFGCFEKMQCKGIKPDSTTFICVLNACSNSGLLLQAELYFFKMSSEYGIRPNADHCICMIDLFGRAGKFNKALTVIEKIPYADYILVWLALLGACYKWGYVEIARLAFKRAIHIEKDEVAAYVCMGNVCTAAGMLSNVNQIEVMRMENEAGNVLVF